MNYKRIRKRNICFDVRVKFIDTDFRFCVNFFFFFNNQNLGVSFFAPKGSYKKYGSPLNPPASFQKYIPKGLDPFLSYL